MQENQERELVKACLGGDRRAQETFYRTYGPAALQVCRRYTNSREEAMALLNGGMMKVFEKLGQFRWEGSLEGWIKRVVFHSSIDQFRKQRKRPTLEIAGWDQPTPDTATHELYAEDLCRMIDMLPETSKEVFWLFAVEGYSHAEIAAKLHFSEGNSRWHLNKARQLLRERLNQETHKFNRYAG
ncbi:RNA polymerase sigma-70 factor (ECF subfamily) [Lewinella marina]|uniref:RNA polymerase subunit sigma-24 n=1 Tax=Neolewinella marina TaxID=438751 RepID=A0A2G0CIU0_9BACT|nr:sigma-70 family RNA polymerase sigma factor [Neolewinella marina]NJB84952.1 RNA polymerase sigma-70 factor (ECF subfamily) [Neolewinella marina]PHK99895.1 RNA polymerase subunit sigma-24 [Neolewinella marina]